MENIIARFPIIQTRISSAYSKYEIEKSFILRVRRASAPARYHDIKVEGKEVTLPNTTISLKFKGNHDVSKAREGEEMREQITREVTKT